MSLRARLILGLLALAAAGLITLAAITYAEQRSFLLQRVDQDARAGVNVMSHVLDMCERASAAGGAVFGVLRGCWLRRLGGDVSCWHGWAAT